jgi:hypothetical protein
MNKQDPYLRNDAEQPPLWVEREAARLWAADASRPEAWRRQWSALAQAAGWPCWGTTWRQWAKGDVNRNI